MSFVFVSHASDDKRRVRPVVEALARQGVKLWLDRPGSGQRNFNFDQTFIDQFGIQGLPTGQTYNNQISEALRKCGLVLACISRSLCVDRRILSQELVIADHDKKLIACIIDDIPFHEIPDDVGGLLDLRRLQAVRIDPIALQQALDLLGQMTPDLLPTALKQQWDISRNLVAEIRRKMPTAASSDEIKRAAIELARFPLFPIVLSKDIPAEIVEVFSDHFKDPERARGFLATAMQARAQCNPEACTDRQILVGNGEILNPFQVSSESYWDDIFHVAGLKSPRTVAALLLAPGSPNREALRPELSDLVTNFLARLERHDQKAI
jgi:hypothetical protein